MATWTWRSDLNSVGDWPGDSASPTFSALATPGELDAARGLRASQDANAETTFVAPSMSGDRKISKIVIEVRGTSVNTTDEIIIKNLPPLITLFGFRAELVSGTGSTIDPFLGRVGSFTAAALDQFLDNDTPAAWLENAALADERRLFLPDGKLVVRPSPDSGTDNEVKFELLLGCGF